MSCNVGPNEVVSGLMLSVDMNNTQKSWIGAPTTNLLSNSVTPFPAIYAFSGSIGTSTANYGLAPDGSYTAQLLSVTGTGSGVQFYTAPVVSAPIGTTFTFSFYAMAASQTGWVFATVGLNNSTIISTSVTNIGNGWYRWSKVFTTTILNGTIGVTAQVGIGQSLVVWGGQLELGSFATPYISSGATAASRTSTQAILDLTKNNAITATSLTYNTDGSFSFNGSTNYTELPAAAASMLNPDALTVEAWVYHYSFGPAVQSGRAYINNWSSFNTADQRGFILRTYAYQQNPSFWWCWGAGANTYASLLSSVTMKTYTWYHIVGTFEKNVAAKIYVNGVLTGTQLSYVSNSLVYDTTNGIHIGRSGINNSWMDGKIGVANLYNRALSATEIMQNYNSLKSRYTNDLIQNGLVVNFDATNTSSYSGSGNTWYSFGGYGPNATFNSTPTFTTGNDANFTFDGVKYATISNAAGFMPTTAITFNCWVKPTALNAYHKIFTICTPGTTSINGIYVSVGPSPYQTYFGITTTATQVAAIYTTDLSTMEYSNLCGTYDGTTITLYVNGVSVATQALTGTMKNIGVARISGYDDNTEGFVGNISQIQIYNRALSATEVLQNYNATRGAYLPNMVANGLVVFLDAGNTASYPGTGTAWNDLSGYSRNGTLVNGPVYNSASSGYIAFDGVNDYVTASFALTAGQAVTVAGWLYSSETTATYRNFFDCATASPMIWWNTSGQIEFDAAQYTTTAVYRNQWVYVALSKPAGSSTAAYYVNGVYVSTGATSYTVSALTPTWFNRSGGQTWVGNCSGFSVHSRALSAAEITQNFNVARWRYGI